MQSSQDPSFPDDAVEVGRIQGAWGLKGALKVQAFSGDPKALFSSKCWFLKAAETPRGPGPGRGSAAGLPPLLRVQTAREQGDAVVATAHEIGDRDAAEALKGARVFVSRASFPTPSVDEFYWVDLIGLTVSNRQGLELGVIVGLIETGPHCVIRIQPDAASAGAATSTSAAERLIPFVSAYVDEVDLAGRRVRVDWEATD